MTAKRTFDIDIDIKPHIDREKFGVRAMIYNEKTKRIMPHPAGVYLESVPVDSVTGLCSFDYEYGNEAGFSKVDLLNNNSYSMFHSKDDVLNALNSDVDWSLLEDEDVVKKLPHISNHYDLVNKVKPKSLVELADVIALIRPGKKHLISGYKQNKEKTRKKLYLRPGNDGVFFKKSHSISYAAMIVCVLNKITNPSGIKWG